MGDARKGIAHFAFIDFCATSFLPGQRNTSSQYRKELRKRL
jgi:hypothetical protein